MKKKKPSFIVYAIREIFLVVIGILIAVSINNWNENRSQHKELTNILLNVKEDIKNDIEKIDEVLKDFARKDTIFKRVLNSKYTVEDYKNNPEIAFLILGFPEISFSKRGVSLLEKFKGDLKNKNEGLVQEIIEFHSEQLWEIKVDYELIAEDFKENFTYWKNKSDWWSNYVRLNINEDFINYALESKDYKNRVATVYFLTYNVYLPKLKKFKTKGLELVNKIEENED